MFLRTYSHNSIEHGWDKCRIKCRIVAAAYSVVHEGSGYIDGVGIVAPCFAGGMLYSVVGRVICYRGPSVIDGEDMEASIIALVTLHVPRQYGQSLPGLPQLVPWESISWWW